ncbi:MAG: ATP-binding protein [Candidatus Heimdallarchaeota archaeon]|nr:ATP-binding protein [Candidatus Heimdallarchaeota archaeon]MDH5645580.1 ATP-binding protein [Candidatus Heimdallarchaeota archaeon]
MTTDELISISNYKGISYLEFQPKEINIIVGPNNTGKSSVLEAIGLLHSNDNNFKDIKNFNLINHIIKSEYYTKDDLFFKGNVAELKIDCPHPLEIEIYYDKISNHLHAKTVMNAFQNHYLSRKDNLLKQFIINRKIQLMQKNGKIEIPSNITDEQVDDFVKNKIKNELEAPLQKAIFDIQSKKHLFFFVFKDNSLYEAYAEPLSIDYFPKNKIVRGYIQNFNHTIVKKNMKITNRLIKIYSAGNYEDKKENNIIIDFQNHVNIGLIRYLYQELIKSNSIDKSIGFLKNSISSFVDIRYTGKDFYVTQNTLDKPLPLINMGDGFITLIKLGFLFGLVEKGTIILEEPEQYMHPGYLDILAEFIIENSKWVKFYFSTHSHDLIRSLLIWSERKNRLSKIQILKMDLRIDSSIGYEIIKGTDALEELETIKTDLRGS